eukprot:scaffold13363_cov248-Alexandrium_tamarense.AAC.1
MKFILNRSILLAGLLVPCHGFAPALPSTSISTSTCSTSTCTDKVVASTTTTTSSLGTTTTALFGLANVNDYFASFNNQNNNSDRNDDTENINSDEGQGSSYANVNDYFASFNNAPQEDATSATIASNSDDGSGKGKWAGNDSFGIN